MAVRTAREWGVPPRLILRGTDSAEGWSFTDRVLAVASMVAAEMLCSGCGQLKHEAWNPDSAGWYEVKEATCEGCAAIERHRDQRDGHEPEAKHWVVDTRPPGERLREWNPLS